MIEFTLDLATFDHAAVYQGSILFGRPTALTLDGVPVLATLIDLASNALTLLLHGGEVELLVGEGYWVSLKIDENGATELRASRAVYRCDALTFMRSLAAAYNSARAAALPVHPAQRFDDSEHIPIHPYLLKPL